MLYNNSMDKNINYSPVVRSNLSEKCFEKGLPYQLTGAGFDFEQYEVTRQFGFCNYQWIQTVDGEGKIELGRTSFVIEPGQGAILYPKEFHRYYPLSKIWKVHWVSFDGCLIDKLLKCVNIFESTKVDLTQTETISQKIYKAVKLIYENTPFGGIDGSVLVYSMLLDFHKYFHVANPDKNNKANLTPVISYIHQNVEKYFTLKELSEQINVSEKYLCQLFKKEFGTRPLEYVNSIKIKQSKNILKNNTTIRIADVAKQVGIDNVSYFSRLFKDVEGISPKKYQIKNC